MVVLEGVAVSYERGNPAGLGDDRQLLAAEAQQLPHRFTARPHLPPNRAWLQLQSPTGGRVTRPPRGDSA